MLIEDSPVLRRGEAGKRAFRATLQSQSIRATIGALNQVAYAR
jgi:hypothetical protein